MKMPSLIGSLWPAAPGRSDFSMPGRHGRLGGAVQQQRELDPLFIWSAIALLIFGLVMVYSSSIAYAEGSRVSGHNSTFFLMRHAVFLCVGVVAGIVAVQVPLSGWQRAAPYLFAAGVVLLIAVCIPHIGREVNGSRRWLPLGPVNLQPSELMKLFAVLYAADYTVRKLPDMGSFKRAFLPMAAVIIFVGFLFLGGLNARIFALLFVVALVGFVLLIWLSPYRRERLFNFVDPWRDAYGSGYQLSHALIAFGRGEWFGVGLGASVEKLFYLPEAHTDFLLAVIAEELGFAGVLTVVVLFGILVQRAFAIGRRALLLERYYGGLVAQGIGLWLGFQGFINMGVNMGLLPTKGLTLPLMSFGGSGIVANCMALAVLLRIDWENRHVMRGVA